MHFRIPASLTTRTKFESASQYSIVDHTYHLLRKDDKDNYCNKEEDGERYHQILHTRIVNVHEAKHRQTQTNAAAEHNQIVIRVVPFAFLDNTNANDGDDDADNQHDQFVNNQ